MDMKEKQLALRQSNQKLQEAKSLEKEIQDSMDKAIQEKIQFKINSDEKREKVEILTEENKSLRQKLYDMDDDNKRLKKQLKNLQ